MNDSQRAQDLWYASSPSSVNSSTLDAMDVIEIENGRWVFSEEWAWKWEPKAGQVCFLHNYFQQFRNHFKAIFWMLQFNFFQGEAALLGSWKMLPNGEWVQHTSSSSSNTQTGSASGQLGGDGTRDYKMPINLRLETFNNRLETNDAINRLQFLDIGSTDKFTI